MNIIKNPCWTDEEHIEFANLIKANDGYCPCSIVKKMTIRSVCANNSESKKVANVTVVALSRSDLIKNEF